MKNLNQNNHDMNLNPNKLAIFSNSNLNKGNYSILIK